MDVYIYKMLCTGGQNFGPIFPLPLVVCGRPRFPIPVFCMENCPLECPFFPSAFKTLLCAFEVDRTICPLIVKMHIGKCELGRVGVRRKEKGSSCYFACKSVWRRTKKVMTTTMYTSYINLPRVFLSLLMGALTKYTPLNYYYKATLSQYI